jgi:subtilisin family serine protease
MDKLTPDLLKMYRRKAVTPVIVEAKPGVFQTVRSQLKSIVPTSLLEARFHTFMPRIMPLIEFPLSKWKEIKAFNMIATVLTPDLIEEVAQWREVQRIYPDYFKFALQTVPTEGVFKDHKGKPFTSTLWTKKMMGLDRANAKGFTGKGVTTVVIDSGARATHEQLRGKVRSLTAAPEKGMSGDDANGHGSWCNSCVGGRYAIDRRYNVPVEGMASECNLISIQALGFIIGTGTSSDIIQAMEMSIGLGAKVVSMSLGSDEAPKDEDNPEAKAVNKLVESGIIPCIAAGNSGPNPSTVGSPGSCLNSLTVAAWDELEGKVADFSSRGPTSGDGYVKPDVAAPGVRINSALVGFLDGLTDPSQPHYGPISGTSMATPHCAGLITCMVQLYKEKVGVELTVDEVKRMMAELGPNQPKDNNVGNGLISWDIVEQWVSTTYGVTL